MTGSRPAVPARLDRHQGEIVDQGDGIVLWLGAMTPTLLADLMREGSAGSLYVQSEGTGTREVWLQRCWYDVEEKRMAVELRERGAPS